MDRREFLTYMNRLEQQVVVPGLEAGLFGTVAWAPIRNGRLHSSELAAFLGTRFVYEQPAVLEYYGLHKRSTGFMKKAARIGMFLSGFEAPFVNFSSVRDVHIKMLCPELLHDFPDFKQAVVAVRFPEGKEGPPPGEDGGISEPQNRSI